MCGGANDSSISAGWGLEVMGCVCGGVMGWGGDKVFIAVNS